MRLLLTSGTNSKKIQPMVENLKTCFRNQFPGNMRQAGQFGVPNLFAFNTDEVWMWIRFVPVISVAPFRKAQFQDLIELFQQGHGFVHGGQARGWEISPDLFKDPFHARMVMAAGQNFEHSYTLGRNPESVLPELIKHCVETNLRIGHSMQGLVMENHYQ
jgi:hypothetical protein